MKKHLINLGLTLFLGLTFLTSRAQSVGLSVDPDGVTSHQDAVAEKYAHLLGVDKDSIKNIKLYILLDQLAHAQHKFNGSDKNGIDGAGLSYFIEKKIYGITLARMVNMQASTTSREIKDLKEGDLVFFSYGDNKTINHVGVYLQNGYFVHTTSNKGVVIQSLRNPDVRQSFAACGSVSDGVMLSAAK